MTTQRPTPPNVWLYKELDEDNRLWAEIVVLPDGEPLWNECTQEERDEWEKEHEPEPEEGFRRYSDNQQVTSKNTRKMKENKDNGAMQPEE